MYVCKSRFRLLALIGLFILTLFLAVDTPTAYGNGGDNQFSIPEKTELKYPNLGSTLDQMAATVEEGNSRPGTPPRTPRSARKNRWR